VSSSHNGTDLLIAAHSAELSGGAEVALLSMLDYLDKEGVSIHVVSPYDGDFTRSLRKTLPKVSISYTPQPWWVLGKADPADFKFTNDDYTSNVLVGMISTIRKMKPRMCMTNTIAAPWMAYAAALTNLPHVWFLHELALDFKTFLSWEETVRTIDELSDKIFCNSKYTASFYANQFIFNDYPGIVYPLTKKRIPDKNMKTPFINKNNKFIMVGSIIERKGQEDAVVAIKLLRERGIDAELSIIGAPLDNGYYEHLRQYIETEKLNDRIHFLGVVKNPASYIQYADAMLMCSEAEAFGLVTVEAMQLGKPVIGADDAGTSEIVSNRKNGLLYKLRDANDLANKMRELIEDPKLSKKLSTYAAKDVAARFSPENCYRDFLKYIRTAPKKRNSLALSPLLSVVNDYEAMLSGTKKTLAEKDAVIDKQQNKIEKINSHPVVRAYTVIKKFM
jgi:glycosyltransferase involved in cell wall biosynthesis